ncbi:MAG: sigma 54-interacting transcriptional regulator [Myxococcaceae bacterium]
MKSLIERGNRRPFHVRVLTDPPIHRCWSVNISETGIGLIGNCKQDEGPQEGSRISMELNLPEGHLLRARGEVRWRHDSPAMLESATTAFGVHFTGFEGADRVVLARYLEGPGVRVAVAFADEEMKQLIRRALADVVQLEFGDDNPEVEEILARGDVSALLVCGDDEVRALLLAELASAVSDDNLTFEGRPRDLAARLVLCAKAEAKHVVKLFNEGKVYRRLEPPLDEELLREVTMAACADHAIQVEQERMTLELERNLQRERAIREKPKAPPLEAGPGFQSPKMTEVMELLRIAAPHKVSVLLQGETGTGKEVLARIVHRLSDRRDAAFVVQDCGTLTETLLESELFGHVRGSFTGAVADHPGLFVLADGGTVFLDEIENTTPGLQTKLLRVLETGEVRPVGGTRTRKVDVRLVAASNRDLEHDVASGSFRGDLFYRLNTFVVHVPPLREREADLVALARYFVDVFNHQLKKGVSGLSTAVERALVSARWPGNVRELRNVIERAVLLAPSGSLIELQHLPPPLRHRRRERQGEGLRSQLEQTERELLSDALQRHSGVIRRAAKELEMDPVTFARRARKLGVVASIRG